MNRYARQKMVTIIEEVARNHGISSAEVRRYMMEAIEGARRNPDIEAQVNFSWVFEDRTPAPEEFIYCMADAICRHRNRPVHNTER